MLTKSLVTALLLISLASAAFTQKSKPTTKTAKNASTREQSIAAAADAMADRLSTTRRDFHMHPELSNREERTSRVVAERLKEIGFTEVRTGVALHGVVALLKGGKPGPVIAVRADMDALPIQEVNEVPYKSQNPGVKHACGHDVHTTVELGVAEVLWKMRDQIPGTIKFIFQPAEEGAPLGEEGGAALMLKEGAFENPKPQVVFGLHSDPTLEAGTIGYGIGGVLASADRFLITIKGKQSHGAAPHLGIDPIVVSAQAILALQTIASRRMKPTDPLVITIGMINGGLRNNIIAPEVKMDGTLRTLSEDVHARVPELMREVLDGVTKANGATFEFNIVTPNYPVTYNDPKLVEETLPVMQKVIGAENVIKKEPVMGAEDFSFFAKQVPGFFYFLGVGNKAKGITAGVHTADFDVDEKSLTVGVKMMSNVLLDYLERHAGDK